MSMNVRRTYQVYRKTNVIKTFLLLTIKSDDGCLEWNGTGLYDPSSFITL